MLDYIRLGHMSVTPETDDGYYTRHHCVRISKKFRVVFNASSLSDTGISLNQTLMVGEKLQDDLADQIDNFRRYPVAITADIAKMYRQIDVHPADRKFQKIFWREKPTDPLLSYELNTVTYGQACAPHCAVRSLQQCIKDYQDYYPLAAHQASHCFYMDDYLGGADDDNSSYLLEQQLEELLAHGQFELTKWCSNTSGIRIFNVDVQLDGRPLENVESTSILGLRWMPEDDILTYNIPSVTEKESWTKREIASQVGKLYDPLGFAAPLIVAAKLLIQSIWLAGCEWDEPVPQKISKQWTILTQTFRQMNYIISKSLAGMVYTLSRSANYSDFVMHPMLHTQHVCISGFPVNLTKTRRNTILFSYAADPNWHLSKLKLLFLDWNYVLPQC